MKTDFGNWLEGEIEQREWNTTTLARKAGVNPGNLSRVMSGHRNAGVDMCQAIAKALGYPVETVFRQAGLLPQATGGEAAITQLVEIAQNLTEAEREELLAYALWRYHRQEE